MQLTAQDIASAMKCTVQYARRFLAQQNTPYEKQAGGRGNALRVYSLDSLPQEIQIAVLAHQKRQEAEQSDARPQSRIPAEPKLNDRQRANALAKADLVRLYLDAMKKAPWGKKDQAREDFMRAYNSGVAYPKLFKELGETSWKSIERWKKTVQRTQDPLVLAEKRGYCKRGRCGLTQEQKDILLQCLLNPNKPFVSEALRMARSVMQAKGIPDGLSDATYRRWLETWKATNYHVWVFNREGASAWNDKCAYSIERDYNLINVGDIVVADGHVLNFEVLNPWTGKSKRMTLILWYDMKSNFPLGWEIMPTENTQAIASALRRAILRLGKYPRVAYLDNGKAFRARFFEGCPDFTEAGVTGLFERLGIAVQHAWAYHGQSKTVERFFGTFGEVERLAPTYTGNNIENKPARMHRGEKLHRAVHQKATGGQCLTLEQAHRAIASWFDLYVQRPQRGHLEGQTPLEVFEAGKGPGVDAAELNFLMMSEQIGTVTRQGIRFNKRTYYAPELYGLRAKVAIRYDLQDPSYLLVYDLDGEFICSATEPEKCHPAARLLGDDQDVARLERQIEFVQGQKKEASASARAFLEEEVLPEQRRQLERMGVSMNGKEVDAGKVKRLPVKQLTKEEERRVDEELAELEAMNAEYKAELAAKEAEAAEDDYQPETETLDEAAEIRRRWGTMNEGDRYEAVMEMTAKRLMAPRQWRAFARYYEETDEYARSADYWETRRAILTEMYSEAVNEK